MSVNLIFDTDSEDELPSGWKEVIADDQNIYYVDQTLNTSQKEHPLSGIVKQLPQELPYGWVRKRCEQSGKDIFYNAREDRVSNIDPRLAFPIISSDLARTRYDSTTTPSQVIQGRDLSGCHVIVTGANSGIGFETSRSLANAGATVIMACRDWSRGDEAGQSIVKENPDARVVVMVMDLSRLSSVLAFAADFQRDFKRLDVLVINAGVMWLPHQTTIDGFETTFQVNYLGHHLLVRELAQLLMRSTPSRLVFLVPESHRFTDLSEQTICRSLLSASSHRHHHPMVAYNTSKMCLALLCYELHRRWYRRGVRCIMVHPGNMVATSLMRGVWWLRWLQWSCRWFAKTAEQGAALVVYAAVGREMEGQSGVYLNNFLHVKASAETENLSTCFSLWVLSNQMINSALSLKATRDGAHDDDYKDGGVDNDGVVVNMEMVRDYNKGDS